MKLVRIKKNGLQLEGYLLPRYELEEKNYITIKLKNGYNVGFKLDEIEVEEIGEKKIKKAYLSEKIKQKENLPQVKIIGTGGTISSKIDYETGAVKPALTSEEILRNNPELLNLARIDAEILFNILSENMQPKHWIKIAEKVSKELNSGFDGVVIAHGTDTMHFTSAALSFMLKNLYKPVVLVGSQRSSDRPSSDAFLNLYAAILVAISDIAEVTVVMHSSSNDDACYIHRGTKVRKMHTSRRDAFKSINTQPIGMVKNGKIHIFMPYRKRKKDETVYVDKTLNEKVFLLKIFPGIDKEIVEKIVDKFDGIVIEGTGLGHVPEYLIDVLEKGINEGKIICMTSQTIYGRVNMNVYATGRKLLSIGVIPLEDMLPEVAYVKLMYVLGKTKDYNKVKELMLKNIAGEISDRSLYS